VQQGAITALKSGDAWFQELNRTYSKRRELMLQLVDSIGAAYDRNASGMFIWAKLPIASKSSEEFVDELLHEKDIFIAPGTIFGSNGEGYIRFSLCVTEEKIKEAIKRFE
jgi:aspartate/methionine/tyrosine aminotransferase